MMIWGSAGLFTINIVHIQENWDLSSNLPNHLWHSGKESACSAGDLGLIPGSGRSLGEGNGNPLQYSCLENPTDRGAWRATVHVFTKSWTQLSSPTRVREPFLFHCSQRHRSYPNSFFVFSLILFCPSWLHGDLSCDFDWMRSSAGGQ